MCFEFLSFEMSHVTQLIFEKNNFKSVESFDLYRNLIVRDHFTLKVFLQGYHTEQCTEVCFASFLSGEFILESKLAKHTSLHGGCWLWACQITGGMQSCIAERSKVPNG